MPGPIVRSQSLSVVSGLFQSVLAPRFASAFRPKQIDEAKDTSPYDETDEGIAQEQLP
jgi:hypothetical protein